MVAEETIAAARQQPVFWFVRLETAVKAGDLEEAAAAVRELRRLGVEVKYRRPPDRKGAQDAR